MSSDRQNQISNLYHAARARAPEDRSAFLQAASKGDEVLRLEVESLLAYESASARFLESPAVGPVRHRAFESPAMIGRQLGPYTILSSLGAGGMGEVYRARDTKLDREVAVKFLPPTFTDDPERRARFAREARLLASLNHPHIGAIYGLEEAARETALILELVEGPTLAKRLEAGPLPTSVALVIARQLAEALEAAHERGIIHRDLKPANIVLQGAADPAVAVSQVRAKVLDFGLGKTLTPRDGDHLTQAANSFGETVGGRVLGTPAYMSPEQARGQPVDRRTDIWAYGCVLYEMLTGRRAFDGDTLSDTLVHILEREPDWTVLPTDTPVAIRTLLRQCLRKDPHWRLHDIADARLDLEIGESSLASSESTVMDAAATFRPRPMRERMLWPIVALLTAALVTTSVTLMRDRTRNVAAPSPIEFAADPPEGWGLGGVPNYALSPDGQYLAAVLYADEGTSMLWVRRIARPSWQQLASTEGARAPFWSPDSQHVGFFANGALRTVRLGGGLPVEICPALSMDWTSATWSRNGVILFAGGDVVQRVSATPGGTPVRATVLASGESQHIRPWFLPDDEHFVYLVRMPTRTELRVGSLSGREPKPLGPFDSNAAYAAGHLLSVRGAALTAQPFDMKTLELSGDPRVLADQVAVYAPGRHGAFSASAAGVLAYSQVVNAVSQLDWVDRKGNRVPTSADPGVLINMDLSPDDGRVAVSQAKVKPGGQTSVDIWVIGLDKGTRSTPLTFEPDRDFDPSWSPDGSYIAYNSVPYGGGSVLYRQRVDGSDQREPLDRGGLIRSPAWTPQGDALVYTKGDEKGGDLWRVPLTGDRKPVVLLQTPYDESSPSVSPDGLWIAYQSDKSGRSEVYVRPFPTTGGNEALISQRGGRAPRWSKDGRELFFLGLDGRLMTAAIDAHKASIAGTPQPLFQTGLLEPTNQRPYGVAKDGRFLVPSPRDARRRTQIRIVWPTALSK
jgi:eukaryotic-like serine/threonine-protein kinase